MGVEKWSITQLRQSCKFPDLKDVSTDTLYFDGAVSVDKLCKKRHDIFDPREGILNLAVTDLGRQITYRMSNEPSSNLLSIQRMQAFVVELKDNPDVRKALRKKVVEPAQLLTDTHRDLPGVMRPHMGELLEIIKPLESDNAKLMKRLLENDASPSSRCDDNMGYRYVHWLDYYSGLAELAARPGYCFPRLNEEGRLMVKDARNPLIEGCVPVSFDSGTGRIIGITGVNGKGKTNTMAIAAIFAMMGQMGGPVPATEADLPVVGKMAAVLPAEIQSKYEDKLKSPLSGWQMYCQSLEQAFNVITNPFQVTTVPRSMLLVDEMGGMTDFTSQAAMTVGLVQQAWKNPKSTLIFTSQNPLLLEQLGGIGVLKKHQVLDDRTLVPGVAKDSSGVSMAKEMITRYPEIVNTAGKVHAILGEKVALPDMKDRLRLLFPEKQ